MIYLYFTGFESLWLDELCTMYFIYCTVREGIIVLHLRKKILTYPMKIKIR